MRFKAGDKVKHKDKVGTIMRTDTEYMEPYYAIQFPNEKHLDWVPEGKLSLHCEQCNDTGLVLSFNHYAKCKDCKERRLGC